MPIAETEMLVPQGPKVAFSGGDTTDHRTIWDRLDQIHVKHPDMVLMHGGSPKGAERIAATWASNRKVPQVAFKPDWTKHAKAAPFKRNDQMLDCLPIGVIIYPGTGIQEGSVATLRSRSDRGRLSRLQRGTRRWRYLSKELSIRGASFCSRCSSMSAIRYPTENLKRSCLNAALQSTTPR